MLSPQELTLIQKDQFIALIRQLLEAFRLYLNQQDRYSPSKTAKDILKILGVNTEKPGFFVDLLLNEFSPISGYESLLNSFSSDAHSIKDFLQEHPELLALLKIKLPETGQHSEDRFSSFLVSVLRAVVTRIEQTKAEQSAFRSSWFSQYTSSVVARVTYSEIYRLIRAFLANRKQRQSLSDLNTVMDSVQNASGITQLIQETFRTVADEMPLPSSYRVIINVQRPTPIKDFFSDLADARSALFAIPAVVNSCLQALAPMMAYAQWLAKRVASEYRQTKPFTVELFNNYAPIPVQDLASDVLSLASGIRSVPAKIEWLKTETKAALDAAASATQRGTRLGRFGVRSAV